MLCSYGCGQEAVYQFGNGKWCCSEYYMSCKNMKIRGEGHSMFGKHHSLKSREKMRKKRTYSKAYTELLNCNFLCEYGCGNKALYQLKNGKKCCNKSANSCPINRKKNSEVGKQAQNRREVNEKRSKSMKKALNEPKTKEKLSKSQKIAQNRADVREMHKQYMLGENSPAWNPNREEVFAPYTESFYDLNYREQIMKEQNYVDPITDKKLTKRACLHHIDYNKGNDRRENLIYLNLSTHVKTNFHRGEWKVLLLKINKDITNKRIISKDSVNSTHVSEVEQDQIQPDIIIMNDSDKKDLHRKVEEALTYSLF